MLIDEKKKIAESLYLELGYQNKELRITRLEDAKADLFELNENQKGIGGILIADDGSYLICGSAYSLSYYIEEFKKGKRHSKGKMRINGQIVNTNKELIDLIKKGINPLEYIENQENIEFICDAITHEEQSQDPYWDDMAKILLKAIINYLVVKNEADKSLKKCLEISNLGINKEKLDQLFHELNDEAISYMYKPIEIAPDRTYGSIVDTLIEKLSKLVK